MSASSGTAPDPAAARRLGQLLAGAEAKAVADRLTAGDTLTAALRVVAQGQRAEARALLQAACPADAWRGWAVGLLRAIEGSRSLTRSLDPLWTMPGHLARGGPLHSSVTHLVDGARHAVTCSTFNMQRTSGLWEALRLAARRPEVGLRVYLDTQAADGNPRAWSPSTAEVAAHLHPGAVLRTTTFDGGPVRNHAKFLAIDHRFLLVTSANFSWSAEYGNVELGVLVDDPNLTEAVEAEMRRAEDVLYERVS